jgi:membrane associated rhomboid family serine protease
MELTGPDPQPDPELAAAPAVLQRFKRALNWSMAAVIALSAIFFLQDQFDDLQAFMIRPQLPAGLVGVLTAPLLHGSLEHLAANALSVLILGTLAGTVYPKATLRALPLIWLGSGLGTWLIATGGSHLGASGVTHGLGFLLFTLGVLRRDRPAIAAALIAFFFFGGMLMTVLPQEMGVSWEYHLSGAVFGVLAGILWRRADPAPPRRRYSWEDEPEPSDANDPLELPSPEQVPVIWQRPPSGSDTARDNILRFPPRDRNSVN